MTAQHPLDMFTNWLNRMGIQSIYKISRDIRRVVLRTKSGSEYTVYLLFFNQKDIIFESPIEKFGTSKNPQYTNTLLEILLRYNGFIYPHQFGIIDDNKQNAIFVLRTSRDINSITPHILKEIFDGFHNAYEKEIPRLLKIANDEIKIDFHGKRTSGIDVFMNRIFSHL
jgi:hypothetical protein